MNKLSLNYSKQQQAQRKKIEEKTKDKTTILRWMMNAGEKKQQIVKILHFMGECFLNKIEISISETGEICPTNSWREKKKLLIL